MRSNKLHVAFLSYWDCPLNRLGVYSSGGMNVYIFNLTNALEKKDIRVDIYTRSHREEHDKVVYLSDNITLIHLPVSESDDYKGCLVFADKILNYINEKKIHYDLLHSHYYYSGLSAAKLSKILSLPLVNSFHTLGEMKKKYLGIIDNPRINSEKEIVDCSDMLIASTELEKNVLLTKYNADKTKVKVINPGVDHLKFRPLSKTGSRNRLKLMKDLNYILFVGRIDPVKGITTLLEACAKLNNLNSDFKKCNKLLIIGGDIKNRDFWQNPEALKIRNYINDLGLSDCTEFLGAIPHHLLSLYYSAADVVVLPSVYESFGLVILEAMSCRACVLVSRVGGLKYLVKNKINGMHFRNNDADDLATQLKNLLSKKSRRSRLATNAYKYSKNFSWLKSAGKMSVIYKVLMQYTENV